MAFHYFLPGCVIKTDGSLSIPLSEFGLHKSLSDVDFSGAEVTMMEMKMPVDGTSTPGVFFTCRFARPSSHPFFIKYAPDKQDWITVDVGDRKVLIGWEKETPPTPDVLERKMVYDGYPIPGASGRSWQVPIARGPACSLPSIITFDVVTEEPTSKLDSAFDNIWKATGEIYDHWNSENTTLTESRMSSHTLAGLQVNYRIGPVELMAFEEMGKPVFSTVSIYAFGIGMIGAQIANEVKKKLLAAQNG